MVAELFFRANYDQEAEAATPFFGARINQIMSKRALGACSTSVERL